VHIVSLIEERKTKKEKGKEGNMSIWTHKGIMIENLKGRAF
jgi:hypothetical protein